jgi:hypothetical protein
MALNDNLYWVRLVSARDSSRNVVFNTMPIVSEAGNVNYQQISPTHMPGSYQVYENTSSRTYDLSDIKLISRNSVEARENLIRLNQLRAWRFPYFGNPDAVVVGGNITEDQASELRDYLGAPPEVLYLSAYSSNETRGNIFKIPTVMSNLSITYPNDVDYIPTAKVGSADMIGDVPFPVIMTIGITLTEQHSADEYERFNLIAFKNGQLTNF